MLLLTAFIGLSHSLQVSKLSSPLKKFMNRCSSSSRAQYNRNSLMCIDSKGACCKVTLTSARFLSLKEDYKSSNERKVGLLVLLTVPLAWGTFEPAVRYVYAIKPAMPGLVFSAGYYLVAAVSLLLLTLVDTNHPRGADSVEKSVQCEGRTLPIRGGLELGSYLFFGNALQVIGLQTVPSDRAAFLLQLTTIFVPLVQAAIRLDISFISLKTWAACFVALFGVAVIGLDGQEVSQGDLSMSLPSLQNLSQGDWLIVAAAFSYTFHCIRLEQFAKETSAIKLGAAKATTELILCLSFNLALLSLAGASKDGSMGYAVDAGQEIFNYVTSLTEAFSDGSISMSALYPTIGAVIWTGLIPVAYTITAQSFGQSRVEPITANLIYTIQPLCTALFAFGLLGEKLGPAGYLGGALIATAVLLVAVD